MEELIAEREDFVRGKDKLTGQSDELTKEKGINKKT
jgi:hypothetical protein